MGVYTFWLPSSDSLSSYCLHLVTINLISFPMSFFFLFFKILYLKKILIYVFLYILKFFYRRLCEIIWYLSLVANLCHIYTERDTNLYLWHLPLSGTMVVSWLRLMFVTILHLVFKSLLEEFACLRNIFIDNTFEIKVVFIMSSRKWLQ